MFLLLLLLQWPSKWEKKTSLDQGDSTLPCISVFRSLATLLLLPSPPLFQLHWCFSGWMETLSSWLFPKMTMWLLNAVVVGVVLAKVLVYGEPVTRKNTSASISYWRHRRQAQVDMERVSTCLIHPSFRSPDDFQKHTNIYCCRFCQKHPSIYCCRFLTSLWILAKASV